LTYRDPASEYSGRQLRCLHVGRLTHKKSPVRLIQAFAIARNKLLPDIDLHLSIAGDGPLRLEVEQAVSHKNLTGIVKLLGAIKHKEVLERLRQSHIYTQYCETAPDGDQEGQGITFAEASASGLPIITTRHNGIPDVVLDGKTGYLVEEGDVEGMAERI